MVNIRPQKLSGNWTKGVALDLHTISSSLIGYDEFGHHVFDTKRSEMGELLYRLKYKSDKSALNTIAETAANFLVDKWKISNIVAGIIPVPPSRTRTFQPVIEIARKISSILKLPLYDDVLEKVKDTPQLKDIYEYEKRLELLKGVFKLRSKVLNRKSILIFDDLYRSGATLNAITDTLRKQGNVIDVYVLTLTRTRSRS